MANSWVDLLGEQTDVIECPLVGQKASLHHHQKLSEPTDPFIQKLDLLNDLIGVTRNYDALVDLVVQSLSADFSGSALEFTFEDANIEAHRTIAGWIEELRFGLATGQEPA